MEVEFHGGGVQTDFRVNPNSVELNWGWVGAVTITNNYILYGQKVNLGSLYMLWSLNGSGASKAIFIFIDLVSFINLAVQKEN